MVLHVFEFLLMACLLLLSSMTHFLESLVKPPTQAQTASSVITAAEAVAGRGIGCPSCSSPAR